MSDINKNGPEPLIFVTGIGQTWSTLKGDPERWNLFPRSRKVLLNGFRVPDYLRLARLACEGFISIKTGKGLSAGNARKVISSIMKYCIPDRNGKLPPEVDVRIYGSRSFNELRYISLLTGEKTDNFADSFLDRIYRDIPCGRIVDEEGEKQLFCFNYSSFSRLYADADSLHGMIKEVLRKTGAEKAVLIPMSMGATVVNAYLDKYGSELVSKVVSIVGAWKGSDAMADLLLFRTAKDAQSRLDSLLGGKAFEFARKANQKKLHNTLAVLIDAFVETVLLKTTTFMALIPPERYGEVSEKYFTPERFSREPYLKEIQAEAERYHAAQTALDSRLHSLNEKYGTEFYFISGYSMKFGEGSGDFSFLGLMESAEGSNTDGVIQISSTTPGTTAYSDGSIDSSTSYFPGTSWYFRNQKHELGTNNTALRLAFDIAKGRIKDINGKYPQFNEVRDVTEAYRLLEKAGKLLGENSLSEESRAALSDAVSGVENMLESVINNPADDKKAVSLLRKQLDEISQINK